MIIKCNGFEIETAVNEAVEFVKSFSNYQKPKKETASVLKKKKTPSSKRDLDMGKIKALRKAGWTLAEIGDEMGVTSRTISNKLAREGQ